MRSQRVGHDQTPNSSQDNSKDCENNTQKSKRVKKTPKKELNIQNCGKTTKGVTCARRMSEKRERERREEIFEAVTTENSPKLMSETKP